MSGAKPADLGDLNKTLTFACKLCQWRPPGGMKMEGALLHFQVEHDTDKVAFDLVPVCSCGASMAHVRTAPTGGGFRDHVKCGACGSTGFVRRGA